MPTLRVMTYNILYGGVGREELIREVLAAIRPDIAVFTEATGSRSFDRIADAVGPHRAGREGRSAREYPVIASRWPIVQSDLHGPPWARRKWVVATVQPSGTASVTIHGVHLVPHLLWPFELCRRQEVLSLLQRLRTQARGPHIVAGDFNAVMTGDSQRWEGAPPWVRAQAFLQGGRTPRWAMRLLIEAGYVDCYRACHPQDAGFTVPAWSPAGRIDYIFASADLAPALRGSGTGEPGIPAGPTPRAPGRSLAELLGWKAIASLGGHASDHLPVWADFEWPPEPTT